MPLPEQCRFFRAEQGFLLLFNRVTARSALVSGQELSWLCDWAARGRQTPFVQKLMDMDMVADGDRQALGKACSSVPGTLSPLRSFAVPESLHVELTSVCNFTCPACYKGGDGGRHLDFFRLAAVLREAAALRVFQVAFGGGEPMLYPHLEEAVRLAAGLGFAVSLTSNGSFDTERLQELVCCGIHHVQISLNGSTDAVNSRTRSGYAVARAALEILGGSGLSFGVNWVATRENLPDLGNFLRLCRTTGAGNCNILRLKPHPDLPECIGERATDLHAQDYTTLQGIIRDNRGSGLEIRLDSGFSHLRCILHGQGGFMSGCSAGRRFAALGSDGRFRPCSHVAMPEEHEGLAEYWRKGKGPTAFRRLEEELGEPCGICVRRFHCRGCRAIAWSILGDFRAGMRNCPFFRPEGKGDDRCSYTGTDMK